VLKVNMDTNPEHVTRLQFSLEIPDVIRPEQLINRLSSIQNVFEVRRGN
jgi:(p)ppGpp synthase/HD superfamily hydrolase